MLPIVSENSVLLWIYLLGAICTLGIFTILYGENRIYRLFEHFFIGLAVGYGLFINIRDVIEPVWFKAIATESSGVIASFDRPPKIEGVILDKVEKQKGDGSWRWSPSQAPKLRLTKIPTDWGAPNYLRLWVRLDKLVPDGQLTFRIRIFNQDTKKPATLTATVPTGFSGWRELLLDLRRDFRIVGQPYRLFREVGRHRVLGGVTEIELEANAALQKAEAKVHLDEWRHCIGYRWWWAFALVWGLMFYTILSPRFAWMSRTALSVLMGLWSGYTFKGFVLEVGLQIYKSFKPILPKPFTDVPLSEALNNLIFVAVLLCVMTYFFFSVEHRHPVIREPARLGRWLLMLTFGIIFGNTVMGRFSLFIGRLDSLLLQVPPPLDALDMRGRALLIVILAVVVFWLAHESVQREQRRQQQGGVT